MMGKEEEIVRIAKRLDKMVTKKSTDGAMDLLKELKSMPITLDLLQSTRIGMSVNALRKQSTDDEVISLAKSLIKSWKKLLDASEDKNDEKKRNSSLATSSKDASDTKDQSSNKKQDPPRTLSTPKITTFPPIPITCDAVRNKCREMLTAALQTDNGKSQGRGQHNPERDLGCGNGKGLKSKSAAQFEFGVLFLADDELTQLASHNEKEMASNELKEIRKAMTKEAIREHQMAKTGGTQTDLFTCGKCKKKNCTYTQVQTRSSDEPMTTFVVCNECGNRWKFC
ncbi:transcription elongation factor A protein 2 isoform X2 [Phascolarctos cinereus]